MRSCVIDEELMRIVHNQAWGLINVKQNVKIKKF